ncbi:MAG TPA: DUF445 family protein, partial [Sporolactobacillaceae bacterium]|nr:DUF445 family protein [Sporolactobacillaceae bacterium]
MSIGHVISTILLLTVVGAIIGGATNHIAIKMLFKPYYPIMIGKWRLPFTPGLIPKRHDEIAQELGRLVMKHLITADRLKLKLQEKGFSEQLSQYVKAQVSKWFSDKATIRERLAQWTDPDRVILAIENKMSTWMEEMLNGFLASNEDVKLGKVLPEAWLSRADKHFPEMARYITTNLSQYLQSEEGKETVTSQLNQMLEGKGFFGNMLGLFLGNQSIVDKIYPELVAFLNRPTFVAEIENLLRKEWEKWLGQSFGEVVNRFDLQTTGTDWVKNHVVESINIRKALDKKPSDLLENIEGILEKMIPKGVDLFLDQLTDK